MPDEADNASDGEQGGDHDAEEGDATKEMQILRTQSFCLMPRQLPRAKWNNTAERWSSPTRLWPAWWGRLGW